LKYEDSSIGMEKRYDNLLTKSQILEAMGRKDEAAAAKNEALVRATGRQLYYYGTTLQSQGKQDQAFDFFRQAAQKDRNDRLVHDGLARIYSAKGDFENALKEMKLSLAGAPDTQKIFPAASIKTRRAPRNRAGSKRRKKNGHPHPECGTGTNWSKRPVNTCSTSLTVAPSQDA